MTVVPMPSVTLSNLPGVVEPWFARDGELVEPSALIAIVQVGHITVDVIAPVAGQITQQVPIDTPVAQGASICVIANPHEQPSIATRNHDDELPWLEPDPMVFDDQ